MLILISPSGGRKGIMVIKHLEYPAFISLPKRVRAELKESYYVGAYFGYAMNLARDWDVDFYIADYGVLTVKETSKPRIFLNGMNFIRPQLPETSKADKSRDFILVGSAQFRKQIPQFIDALVDLAKMGRSFNASIVLRTSNSIESKLVCFMAHRRLARLSRYPEAELDYIELSPHSSALPRALVLDAISSTKYLVCPSTAEGAARVIGEAVLCDTQVIANGKMRGGSLNYLSDAHGIIYSAPKALSSALNRAINLYAFKVLPGKEHYIQETSVEKLIEFLLERNFASDADATSLRRRNLVNAFSGHQNVLDRRFTSSRTDEILTKSKMLSFACFLLGKESDPSDITRAYFADLADVPANFLRRTWRAFKLVVRKASSYAGSRG